jgi:hypothetical protein
MLHGGSPKAKKMPRRALVPSPVPAAAAAPSTSWGPPGGESEGEEDASAGVGSEPCARGSCSSGDLVWGPPGGESEGEEDASAGAGSEPHARGSCSSGVFVRGRIVGSMEAGRARRA